MDDGKIGEHLLRLVQLYRDGLYLYHQILQCQYKEMGLTMLQAKIIHLLKRDGPQPLGQVSRRLDMPNSSLSEIVDRLEDRGLLCRERDQKDRRVVRVHLSPACLKCLEALEEREVQMLRQMWPHAELDDIFLLTEKLSRFVKILSKTIDKGVTVR
ncbi:MarR family winged helix-turn-helix transcriptional regulator [Laceyella sacchari]|uniref:MarR family transcriptional regulator n=1 Tax=Laceyella sacchari TaxID=37482 RepID=A0ABY5U234_LACSH|nr:MarR family transcriptional regulator [Laceyella sacchari]UWE03721.1 MarR family transcriptional regulator [Laceyella sacchari]